MRYEFQAQPEPTVDLVLQCIKEFDQENETIELALRELVERCPANVEPHHVLLKVAAINQLYRTQIYAVEQVAQHIRKLSIDAELESGSPELVSKIARVELAGKVKYNVSFASKYCSWHRPELFPIYDSRAELCLCVYGPKFKPGFARKDLWTYKGFVECVKAFRVRFGLEGFSFKDLDKFLYLTGDRLTGQREDAKTPQASATGAAP
jgi:hypothetical protein